MPRFYRITLSENQMALVELALETLSPDPGDEEAVAENEATLGAVRDTAEEVK